MCILKSLARHLRSIADNIDAGNSNISETEAMEILDQIRVLTDKDVWYSKYQSYNHLHISRATFDNLVRDGKLPKGVKSQGSKELKWKLKDLDNYKASKL